MESRKGKNEIEGEVEKEKMLEKILRIKWRKRPMGSSKTDKELVEN